MERSASLVSSLLAALALAGCGDSPTVINTNKPDLATPAAGADLATRSPDMAPDMATACGMCPPATPICDTGKKKCVGCLSDQDCPGATVCRAAACQPGCSASRSECGDAGSCDFDAGVCHGCLSDRDCTNMKTPACEPVSGRCLECLPTNDVCAQGTYCVALQGGYGCMPGCRNDGDCQLMMGINGACCAHKCIDISSSKDNCGACGMPCGNGACCGKRCVDTQSDLGNCGGCGKVCQPMNNQPQCKAGQCTPGNCLNGFVDCDGMPGNGCEVNTQSDRNNCGGCGMACAAANADTLCLNAVCEINACKPGFRDCNGSYGDGCEINVLTDSVNCGLCGNNCAAVPHAKAMCAAGACAVTQCDAGYGNCNKLDNDGCETNVTSDQNNCGMCGKVCPGPANTVITCTNGVCGNPGGCLSGFKDCDNNMANGCEININSDPNNCGGCGTSCGGGANGVAACRNGVCTLTCNNGFGDCDGNKGNGCETAITTDKNNCGACGNVCPMNNPLCTNGKCNSIVKSCQAIVDGGLSVGDGVYMIDPDGMGGNPPFAVFCEMTTDGGGWEVMAYLRNMNEWNWQFYSDNGAVGDVQSGFSSGATLQKADDVFNEKIIIYLNLIENGGSLGKQFMVVRRIDNAPIAFSTIQTAAVGWSFRDSFGKTDMSAGNVCTHGCGSYRTHGMFHDVSGIQYHGTQGGDNGCRDGNNICWMSRGLGCNVGAARCAYLTGQGEGVIYGVRNKP